MQPVLEMQQVPIRDLIQVLTLVLVQVQVQVQELLLLEHNLVLDQEVQQVLLHVKS